MAIVTLTTDLGIKDPYVGMVKGALLKACPEVAIIDISHQIEPFNILDLAFVVKNACRDFPEDTIHLLSVNELDVKKTKFLALRHKNQYFLGADTGAFSLIFDDFPDEITELDARETTFPLRDVLVPAACQIIKSGSLEGLGNAIFSIQQKTAFLPVIEESSIRGTVIYIDNYENVITNITQNIFEQAGQGRKFTLYFKRNDTLDKISTNYNEVPEGEVLCLFNTAGNLEIAINKGKAAGLLGLRKGDIIQVEFS